MRAALGAPGAPRFSFRRTRPRADGARRAFARAPRAGAAKHSAPSDAEVFRRHLASEAPGDHHFDADDDDAAHGVDAALASWDHPDASDPSRLAAIVARASGLEEVLRDADASPSPGSKGGGGARTDARRAASAARGRAASMFNLALSSLHLRGGAGHAQAALSILLDFMPAMGVAPDVVARCVVADACARAGDAEAVAAVLADARDAAGAGKRSKSKEKKKKKKTKRKATAGPVEALGVLWEDDGLAAVRKPAGWLTHGTDGKRGDEPTLVDALLDRFGDEGLSSINPNGRGIVHRLDRPTSGVMIVAKTDASHAALVTAWFQRRVQKTYVALAEGHPGDKAMRGRERGRSGDGGGDGDGNGDGDGDGDGTLARDEEGTVRAAADGRPAVSDWRVLETYGVGSSTPTSLVEVRPRTGRKHQVRQHLGLVLDAPLVGDTLYRKGKAARTPPEAEAALATAGGKPGSVFYLHALALELTHPETGGALRFEDAPPPAFEGLLRALRAEDGRREGQEGKQKP